MSPGFFFLKKASRLTFLLKKVIAAVTRRMRACEYISDSFKKRLRRAYNEMTKPFSQ
jgi:hypothetical protein